MLQSIKDHIIFQFLDQVDSRGMFLPERTLSGLYRPTSSDDSAKLPRWAKVVALGPDCDEDLRVEGCEILIGALRWTKGGKCNGQSYWRTDQKEVLGYRYPEDKTNY